MIPTLHPQDPAQPIEVGDPVVIGEQHGRVAIAYARSLAIDLAPLGARVVLDRSKVRRMAADPGCPQRHHHHLGDLCLTCRGVG